MNLKFLRSAKISLKLTLIYAFMFSLILLVLSSVTLYGTKYFLYKQANKQVQELTTITKNKINEKQEQPDLYSKEFFLDIPSKENIYIKISDKDGAIINQSRRVNFNIKSKSMDGKIKRLEQNERHLIYLNTRVKSAYGVLYIQVVKDLENEYSFMKILFIFMAITDFIGILASLAFGYIISKKMLIPIDKLTKTAENISINNLKERIEVEGPDDELRRLGSTFNNMIDRLQKAFDSQVQFVSDASHELRTPIAIIQGYANLLDRWGKDDKEALEKSIYGIKLEASNMANLIEKLLFLAKGDSSTQIVEKQYFKINELIEEVVQDTRLIDNAHLIKNRENAVTEVYADYKLLKQMLRIFIENSIKFTPQGGLISVDSVVENGQLQISVMDTGIGIPEEDINNIFDRFYTVDKSRSKEKGGSGLGLSIARWIAEVHNAKLEILSEEGRGTTVIVKLDLQN
jgi:signal transduction histidine kinase